LSFGGMGGSLVIKLVKPTKVFCSCSPSKNSISHVLPPETQPCICAAAAGILGKTDATVRQKLGGLDSPDRVLQQSTEFLPPGVGNCGVQVSNLNLPPANEHDAAGRTNKQTNSKSKTLVT